MNLFQSICKSIEAEVQRTDGEPENDLGVFNPEASNEPCTASEEETTPRDGMSAESAVFQIGKCKLGNGYKVRGVKNKGRYFIAKVLDKNGSLANEIMVDKLNGRVKFIR